MPSICGEPRLRRRPRDAVTAAADLAYARPRGGVGQLDDWTRRALRGGDPAEARTVPPARPAVRRNGRARACCSTSDTGRASAVSAHRGPARRRVNVPHPISRLREHPGGLGQAAVKAICQGGLRLPSSADLILGTEQVALSLEDPDLRMLALASVARVPARRHARAAVRPRRNLSLSFKPSSSWSAAEFNLVIELVDRLPVRQHPDDRRERRPGSRKSHR